MDKFSNSNKVTAILSKIKDRTFFGFIGVSLFEESHALIIEPKSVKWNQYVPTQAYFLILRAIDTGISPQ